MDATSIGVLIAAICSGLALLLGAVERFRKSDTESKIALMVARQKTMAEEVKAMGEAVVRVEKQTDGLTAALVTSEKKVSDAEGETRGRAMEKGDEAERQTVATADRAEGARAAAAGEQPR